MLNRVEVWTGFGALTEFGALASFGWCIVFGVLTEFGMLAVPAATFWLEPGVAVMPVGPVLEGAPLMLVCYFVSQAGHHQQ